MGTMISPGPCLTGCGSRVRVGVKVSVGRGVSEGGRVGVPVGKRIGVTVAGAVGEREAVQVGARVGVGGTIKPNPPHPIKKKTSADTPMRIFL
jgi:hypothetical protein